MTTCVTGSVTGGWQGYRLKQVLTCLWHDSSEIFHPLINSLLSHFMIWASLYCAQCLYSRYMCLNSICYFLYSDAFIISCMEYHFVTISVFAKIIPWKSFSWSHGYKIHDHLPHCDKWFHSRCVPLFVNKQKFLFFLWWTVIPNSNFRNRQKYLQIMYITSKNIIPTQFYHLT